MFDLDKYFSQLGITNLSLGQIFLVLVALGFVVLAVVKNMEPYELLPIGLGMLVANLPLTNLHIYTPDPGAVEASGLFGIVFHYGLSFWNILPPLIFLGIGAMTDFGPIIANPKTLYLGAAAQLAIFVTFWGAPGLRDFQHP